MICKTCERPIEKMIEGEPVCPDCRALAEMSPDEIATAGEILELLAIEKRNSQFEEKLKNRLPYLEIRVHDGWVVFNNVESEIIHWYEPLDLMADEWAGFIRNCTEPEAIEAYTATASLATIDLEFARKSGDETEIKQKAVAAAQAHAALFEIEKSLGTSSQDLAITLVSQASCLLDGGLKSEALQVLHQAIDYADSKFRKYIQEQLIPRYF